MKMHRNGSEAEDAKMTEKGGHFYACCCVSGVSWLHVPPFLSSVAHSHSARQLSSRYGFRVDFETSKGGVFLATNDPLLLMPSASISDAFQLSRQRAPSDENFGPK